MNDQQKSLIACAVVGYVFGCIVATLPLAPTLGMIGYSITHAPAGVVVGLRYFTMPTIVALAVIIAIFALLCRNAHYRESDEAWCWSAMFVSFALAVIGSLANIIEVFGG